jgi:putative colanic acid biosynthesis glycosyltransferase
MKVLQINCVYNSGSTGKIVRDLSIGLLNYKVESIVCYGRGKKVEKYNIHKVCREWESYVYHIWSRLSGVMYGGGFYSTKKLCRIIARESPDVVHIQCINGYFVNIYKLITWLKHKHYKTVLTLHAEFMYTANCGCAFDCEKWMNGCIRCEQYKGITQSMLLNNTGYSWKKMKDAFENFNELVVVSVSPWIMKRAKKSPMLNDKRHFVVFNGLDSSIFHFNKSRKLIEKYCQDEKKIVFHATPFFTDDEGHIKGGKYVIELAEQMPDLQFVVAGRYKDNMKLPKNILLLGKITNQFELANWYSLASITVITSKSESFSMIVAESLCCGTSVVGFQAGGPESIAIPEYSEFVKYGDIAALKSCITKVLEKIPEKEYVSGEAVKLYSLEAMTQNYISIYKTLCCSLEIVQREDIDEKGC